MNGTVKAIAVAVAIAVATIVLAYIVNEKADDLVDRIDRQEISIVKILDDHEGRIRTLERR